MMGEGKELMRKSNHNFSFVKNCNSSGSVVVITRGWKLMKKVQARPITLDSTSMTARKKGKK